MGLSAPPRGWVLVDGPAERSLGPALIWAQNTPHPLRAQQPQHPQRPHDEASALVSRLHLLVEGDEGLLARRAGAFSQPVEILRVEGRELAPTSPEPLPAPARLPAELRPFFDVIEDAGADAVLEGATLRAEVLGLEVGRVVGGVAGPALEVGVGLHDRLAHRVVHPDAAPADLLADVVELVRRHRRAGVPVHPANQLAVARWLRAAVIARPSAVGARRLEAFEGPARPGKVPAPSERRPAAAAGVDADGHPLVAVCSVGVDLDLVPTAVDLAAGASQMIPPAGRSPRLVLVLPEGDDHPATRRLAASLRVPAEVRVVPRDWREELLQEART